MKLNVQPNVILLEPKGDTEEETLESGLIVATKASKASTARISEIHPATSAEYGLSVGDEIVFNPFSVREINLSGTDKRLALHPGDVLAKVVCQIQDEIQLETVRSNAQ